MILAIKIFRENETNIFVSNFQPYSRAAETDPGLGKRIAAWEKGSGAGKMI